VLTRTVAETAALLDVLAGYEPGDTAWAPPPPEPFAATVARAPGPLRIAFTTVPPIPDATVEASCIEATHRAAALLERLGHAVDEVTPPWRREELADLFGHYFAANIAVGVQYAARLNGRDVPRPQDIEPLSFALWQGSREIDAVAFQILQTRLQALMRVLVSFLERYDVLLTPALAQRPLPIGTLDAAAADPLATFARSGYFTPFTPVINASGQPAVSLPLYHGDDGLPLAVQLVGRPAGEGVLLALAAQLEAAEPWAARRAPLGGPPRRDV
jgi:amidase